MKKINTIVFLVKCFLFFFFSNFPFSFLSLRFSNTKFWFVYLLLPLARLESNCQVLYSKYYYSKRCNCRSNYWTRPRINLHGRCPCSLIASMIRLLRLKVLNSIVRVLSLLVSNLFIVNYCSLVEWMRIWLVNLKGKKKILIFTN